MSEKSLWLLIFILVYAAFCFFWGVRGSNYNSDSPEKFYLANKNVSSWVFFFAATAATFSGLTVISQTNLKQQERSMVPCFKLILKKKL